MQVLFRCGTDNTLSLKRSRALTEAIASRISSVEAGNFMGGDEKRRREDRVLRENGWRIFSCKL